MISRLVGMADEVDSKSIPGNGVRVQVPPAAPENDRRYRLSFFLYIYNEKIFIYNVNSKKHKEPPKISTEALA